MTDAVDADPGWDDARLEDWTTAQVPGLAGPIVAQRFLAGARARARTGWESVEKAMAGR